MYDAIDVTAVLQEATRGQSKSTSPPGGTVVFAAQCYHHDSSAGAFFMMQAQITYRSGTAETAETASHNDIGGNAGTNQLPLLHTIASDSSWLVYNATDIYNPTGDLGGDVTGSDIQPREYIDATAFAAVTGWHATAPFTPAGGGWVNASTHALDAPPPPKQSLPIAFTSGAKPALLIQIGAGLLIHLWLSPPRICSRTRMGVPRPPAVLSRCGSLLRTLSADVRSSDDVVAF